MQPLAYSVIDITGEDATAFAHAQFSSDVHSLATDRWQWSSWLDPRGRVRALFMLARMPDSALRLLLRGGDAQALVTQLRMYQLRSRVTLQMQPQMYVTDHDDAVDRHAVLQTGDASMVLGFGDYAVCLSPQPPAREVQPQWPREDIEHGLAWLPATTSDAFLSPALSLRRLEATSLSKGCYPGQEIATRLHHRGGNKRHLCRMQAPQAVPLGTPVLGDGNIVGITLQSAPAKDGHAVLAVLHERALSMDAEHDLRADDAHGTRLRLMQRFDD